MTDYSGFNGKIVMPLNSIEKGMPKTEISIRPKAGKIKDSKKINKNVEVKLKNNNLLNKKNNALNATFNFSKSLKSMMPADHNDLKIENMKQNAHFLFEIFIYYFIRVRRNCLFVST